MNILIIDDDKDYLTDVVTMLRDEYNCYTATSGKKGLRIFKNESIDLVLLDIKLSRDYEGLELLEAFKELDELVPIIMITNYDDVSTVVKSMKKGAYDYFDKKFEFMKLEQSIKNALNERQLILENIGLREELRQYESPIIYKSQKMKEVIHKIRQAAVVESSVLITGETGVGKNLVAKEIHRLSERSDKSFITLNINAIPDTMFESELFGHEKGAFTDAQKLKRGKFELAEGGTVFLDEISEIKPQFQAKLLRVIEDKEFERIGGTRTYKLDVRIISATNRNLDDMNSKGEFRRDLYYRLNVFPIHIPPLRERVEDIEPLVNHFIAQYSKQMGKEIYGVSKECRQHLKSHDWPGNVRELQHTIERVCIQAKDQIVSLDDFEVLPIESSSIPTYKEARARCLEEFKRNYLYNVIEIAGGNITKAAKLMDVPRPSLHEMLRNLEP